LGFFGHVQGVAIVTEVAAKDEYGYFGPSSVPFVGKIDGGKAHGHPARLGPLPVSNVDDLLVAKWRSSCLGDHLPLKGAVFVMRSRNANWANIGW
jgi:hypothetical protein